MNAEQAIGNVVENLVDAWNSRDSAAFSRLFAENADYVTGSGVRLSGRGRIRDVLFGSAPSSGDSGLVTVVNESVKVLGSDVAVILCTWRMGPGGSGRLHDSAGRSGLMTIVTQRLGNEWRITTLQNTDTRP